jgi:predicted ATPase
MGQVFDAEVLEVAADEHPAVVDVGLEQMVKRWLIRPFAHFWTHARRERDDVLWDRGVRRGRFEFSHKFVRRALYLDVDPKRREAMHGHIATALLQREGDQDWEMLAYHCVEAGAWEAALEPLERSAERAHAVHARATALHYLDLGLAAFDRLIEGAQSAQQARHWRGERTRLEDAKRRYSKKP